MNPLLRITMSASRLPPPMLVKSLGGVGKARLVEKQVRGQCSNEQAHERQHSPLPRCDSRRVVQRKMKKGQLMGYQVYLWLNNFFSPFGAFDNAPHADTGATPTQPAAPALEMCCSPTISKRCRFCCKTRRRLVSSSLDGLEMQNM